MTQRGPVQDETQFCDPLDARAQAEIEGRSNARDCEFWRSVSRRHGLHRVPQAQRENAR